MEEQMRLRELAGCRKSLSKSSLAELATSQKLYEATDLALQEHPVSCHVEYLALLAVLFHQIALVVSEPDSQSDELADMVRTKLSPLLQPEGRIATTLIIDLGNPVKPINQRAGEALSSAAELAACLPPPSSSTSTPQNFMIPFFLDIVRNGTSTKTNLTAISLVLGHIPDEVVPNSLVEEILSDISSIECPNLRGSIIVRLLSTRRTRHQVENEEEKDRHVLNPLLPYLDPTSNHPATLTHIVRYILPTLFKLHPTSLKTLLSILEGSTSPRLNQTQESASSDNFSAWAAVASLGVSTGLLNISDLSEQSLEDAVSHGDPEVRLRAFELITNVKDILRPNVVQLIKECLKWNQVLPSSESRTDFSSAFHTFFTRLRAADIVATRSAKKISAGSVSPELKASMDLHRSFLEDYVDPALRSVHRGIVVRIIMGLTLLKMYIDVFGSQAGLIVTEERIQWLLACQVSPYTEVRTRARQIIEIAPTPLPGYEDLSSPSVQVLLNSAYASLGHPRNTQAEAGKATLCIISDKLVRSVDGVDQINSLKFVGELIGKLDSSLVDMEEDLVAGMEKHPLHGLLAAIRDVISCIRLDSPELQLIWRPTFHRIFNAIDRVWAVTRPVISLTAADPSNSTEAGTEAKGAEHEIARVSDILGVDEEGDVGEESDHAKLLSGCWRATKEAGELLSTIIVLPFQSRSTLQILWIKADLARAGRSFLEWLHEIRHRGTFSKIAPAFAKVVEVLRPNKDLRDLCDTWLQTELDIIANDKISITRRSAAIPFSVLSIVSSDQVLLDKAVNTLVDLAKVDNPSSDTSKIHAFNTLNIILLDARQTRLFSRYLERTVMMALGAFTSANWNVRNVGLILFSTMVHRSLSSGRSQNTSNSRISLSSRQTYISWYEKYPSIIPSIINTLKQIHKETKSVPGHSVTSHSPLFPILIIVRSLKWSSQGKAIQDDLISAVWPFLSSVEWQVREVAAQSLSSLLSPEEAIDRSLQLLGSITAPQKSNDEIHGELLLLRRLFSDVINWSDVDSKIHEALTRTFLPILKRTSSSSPILMKSILDIVKVYKELSAPSIDISQAAMELAKSALVDRVSMSSLPGLDLLLTTAAETMVSLDPTIAVISFLLKPGATEDVNLIALDGIDAQLSTAYPQVFALVLDLATSPKSGDAVRTRSLEVLSEMNWSSESVARFSGERAERVFRSLDEMIRRNRCVPLKEAGLPALAWCIALDLKSATPITASGRIDDLAVMLLKASDEVQSEPSRSSSVKALRHLTAVLFRSEIHSSSLLKLHQTLLRLLQDDDDDIRQGAADIVVRGLAGLEGDKKSQFRPVVQAKAVEMWWTWSFKQIDRPGWVEWLMTLSMDSEGFDEDINTLKRSSTSASEILFEVEPPNLYRDPLIDSVNAARILRDLGHGGKASFMRQESWKEDSWRKEIIRRQELLDEIIKIQDLEECSPIDSAWEARKSVERRMGILRSFV